MRVRVDECMGVCESLGVAICVRGREIYKNNSNKQTNYQNIHAPHIVFDMMPGELVNMPIFIAFEWTHAAPHSVCWKEYASANIHCISVTRETSQLDSSWLKDFVKQNIERIILTRDTSHLDRS